MTIALSILIVILLLYIIYVRRKTKQDIDEFAESIINRDFSRKSPRFQSITDAFLNLAAEKEAQQHYLKEMGAGRRAWSARTYTSRNADLL